MGGYTRKGVLYEGPTMKRGRKKKVVVAVSAPSTPRVSKNVKSAIKRAISATEEVKYAIYNIANQQLVTGAGLNTAANLGFVSTQSIIPQISQGSTINTRDGNSICVKSLIVRYRINALPTTITGATAALNPWPAQPFLVRVILFRHKYANDDNSTAILLKAGTGSTAQSLDSSPRSWILPYNKEQYHIYYSKEYVMQPCKRYTDVSNSANLAADASPAPGTKQFVYGRVKVKLPSKLTYSDGTAIPNNAGLYMAVAMCNTDGYIVTSTQTRFEFNADAELYFTDA